MIGSKNRETVQNGLIVERRAVLCLDLEKKSRIMSRSWKEERVLCPDHETKSGYHVLIMRRFDREKRISCFYHEKKSNHRLGVSGFLSSIRSNQSNHVRMSDTYMNQIEDRDTLEFHM